MKVAALLVALTFCTSVSAETLQGTWKIVAAEDLRADGSVARYPWGRHPIGAIVVEGGSCYLQIMSGDVPNFSSAASSVNDQMKASLVSSYIAYTGPCTFDDAAGTTTMKVEGAWRPDYVGTSQTRFYRFEGSRLLYGPAPASMRLNGETLTRRLTLERP
ncbi:MAG: lipocalin-like domain-containing protein [Acidobacteriota bacterium]